MPNNRKPIPKSQKELSNNQVNPYVNPETGETRGNPNETQDFRQFTPNTQRGVDFNRSEKMSFKGDKVKPFTVSIQDVDEAILYYFENVIKPSVIQNGERIAVPLVYGSPERFKTIQKDGFYRDKKGKIMSPIIMFKRDSLDKNRSIANKLDANSPNLYTSWQKSYNSKNFYSNFDLLNNRIPTKQFIANVVPDYVTLTYSFIVQTYYVEQLNKIIEAINYASDSYWGDPERFQFKAMIDTFNTITELNQGQNRVVRSNFSLKVHGYIIPDVIQKDLTAVKKYNTKSKVTFGIETTSGLEYVSTSKPKSITQFPSSISSGGGGTTIDNSVITYLNTNVQREGTYVNSTRSTFSSGWLSTPEGLPATSVNNFSIFVNGSLVEGSAISSFTESGGVTTLIINPAELGYSLSPTDEVIAIGKFSS
tara:strand:- start:1155 stop:2420 length:1266 start_codon:yes stop_codon:yes gene_type:complete